MAKGYHHLTYEDRCQIYALKKSGMSHADIAHQLNVDKRTITREIRRNSGDRGYRYKQAHELSENRRHEVSRTPSKMTPEVIALLEEKIRMQWSPEQISGWMQRTLGYSVSHERIYQHIWRDKKLGGDLYKHLRHRGKKYTSRGSINAGRGLIPGRIDIDERPLIVNDKQRIGDWELDTIIGKNHKGAIVSMVDRASKGPEQNNLSNLMNATCKTEQILIYAEDASYR